ncbi:hypothetical protein UFOVP328_330 [uncultured Caudovirales phage]|uniref:Uncharacterized protein n=1 Tax=uncultured Caudovirales phage TaxID=2100421 RepID=A0A6J5LYI9_9CAUD|nr:hypothetical protein UFOVP328_330 [uncultured Caudovirales phage]
MQIHELTQLNEAGILQGIKSAATSAKSAVKGFQQATQDRKSQLAVQNVSDRAVKAWNMYTKQLKAANPDPVRYAQLYKQALMAFVQKNLLKGQPIANAINRQEITQLVDAISDQADNPTAVTNLFSKLIQQAATSTDDTGAVASQSQVKVINPDPAVLQFRTKTYIINDQGQWADQATGAVADQSFQAYLDQELEKAVPTAQAQLKPKSAPGNNIDAVLQQLGIDTAKITQLQNAIKADPAMADQLKKTLGL